MYIYVTIVTMYIGVWSGSDYPFPVNVSNLGVSPIGIIIFSRYLYGSYHKNNTTKTFRLYITKNSNCKQYKRGNPPNKQSSKPIKVHMYTPQVIHVVCRVSPMNTNQIETFILLYSISSGSR